MTARVPSTAIAMLAQDIVVRLFHDDDSPKPHPVIVINHGRAAKAA
jgi:hypothetical protein